MAACHAGFSHRGRGGLGGGAATAGPASGRAGVPGPPAERPALPELLQGAVEPFGQVTEILAGPPQGGIFLGKFPNHPVAVFERRRQIHDSPSSVQIPLCVLF